MEFFWELALPATSSGVISLAVVTFLPRFNRPIVLTLKISLRVKRENQLHFLIPYHSFSTDHKLRNKHFVSKENLHANASFPIDLSVDFCKSTKGSFDLVYNGLFLLHSRPRS
jgi:hypothetical protein